MKKTLGLAALAMTGCIFVRAAPVSDALLEEGQSAAYERNINRVAVEYRGPWGNDTADDDFIIIKSYGRRIPYSENYRLISSGDSACVLGIRLDFEIINDNDGDVSNNILKITRGRCWQ
ncbi:MAG: hypothetical protein PHO02_05115 [Candidatus Nanoarchaeia archaeon]|nr:hypothetical protein [Candidatus Nanoarchaeia archaeon]